MNNQISKMEENDLLYPDEKQGYRGQELNFKRANRVGDEENQDLTESEILVKTMQEVRFL